MTRRWLLTLPTQVTGNGNMIGVPCGRRLDRAQHGVTVELGASHTPFLSLLSSPAYLNHLPRLLPPFSPRSIFILLLFFPGLSPVSPSTLPVLPALPFLPGPFAWCLFVLNERDSLTSLVCWCSDSSCFSLLGAARSLPPAWLKCAGWRWGGTHEHHTLIRAGLHTLKTHTIRANGLVL